MPNDTINIIRPDGSVTSGTRDELKKLQLLGDYKEETATDKKFRESESATKEMYSGTGDKVKTFASGVASGASLGLLDPLVDTEEEKLRAQYNPKSRLAGEITGGIAPALIPGGEFTPAGALGKLAGGASELVGGGIKGAALAGGIEGAGFGAQSTIANSTLTDDPLTAQSLLSGIGYSSLFGAGLNTAIHGAGRLAERAGVKLEPKVGEPNYKPKSKDLGEIEIVNPDNYNAFRQNIADTIPTKQYVDDYIGAIDSDAAALTSDHAAAHKDMAEQIRQQKQVIADLEKKVPDAVKEHTAELQTAKNEHVLAKHHADKFNADAEEALSISQEQYVKEAKSGGLFTARKELENTYDQIFQKVKAADNPTLSEMSVTIKKGLKKYDSLIKEGDYAGAKDVLGATQKGLKGVSAAMNLGIEVPEVKIGIKANPKKMAELYEGMTAHEERLAKAESKLEELKARGPRDYKAEIEAETGALDEMHSAKFSYPELDLTHHIEAKKQYTEIGKALDKLRNFPKFASEFTGLGTAKVNELGDALDLVMKSVDTIPELQPIVSSLEKATQSLVDSTGIKTEGSIVNQLKAIHATAKQANKQPILGPIEHEILNYKAPAEHHNMFGDGAVAYGASKVLGVGYPGYLAGRVAIEHLAGLKSAVQNKVSRAAKAIGKTFQRTGKNYVVPALQPLYTKLNGGRDKEAKNPREAARNRINELLEITPVVNDTLYKGLEAHAGGVHNAVFAAIHAAAIAGHNALIELLPKDRIGTTVGFKNTWEPNDIETAITAKVLRAFYNPTDVLTDSMAGKLDPIELKTIKAVYPDLYSYVRSEILEQVTLVPELTKSFNNQQALSTLLDIKVSSAFKPENTVDAQAIFVATPEVNNASQGGGAKNNSGGGRPAKSEPPTAAQSLIGK
jgi:hypothetical protein